MRDNNKIKRLVLSISLGLVLSMGFINTGLDASAASTDTKSNTYNVNLDPQGGTVSSNKIKVTVGKNYGTLPVPAKQNYTFRGWYIFPSGGTRINAEKEVTIAKDHTLYAQWDGKDFDITLDANEGTLDIKKISVRYGTRYFQTLPTPKRANYEFSGWYTQKKNGMQITANTLYKDNPPKKLYALWTKRILTIKFVAYNGEDYEKKVTCGGTYGALPKPIKKGSTFKGWFTWKDYPNIDATPIVSTTKVTDTSPTTLFARWY